MGPSSLTRTCLQEGTLRGTPGRGPYTLGALGEALGSPLGALNGAPMDGSLFDVSSRWPLSLAVCLGPLRSAQPRASTDRLLHENCSRAVCVHSENADGGLDCPQCTSQLSCTAEIGSIGYHNPVLHIDSLPSLKDMDALHMNFASLCVCVCACLCLGMWSLRLRKAQVDAVA